MVAPTRLAVAVVAPVIAPGPDHKYVATFDGEFAVSASVLPAHTGPLLVALAIEGGAITVTVCNA